MISLENKNILITGASSGIGKATAVLCHKFGANVILSARRESELKNSCNQLKNNSNFMNQSYHYSIHINKNVTECGYKTLYTGLKNVSH